MEEAQFNYAKPMSAAAGMMGMVDDDMMGEEEIKEDPFAKMMKSVEKKGAMS